MAATEPIRNKSDLQALANYYLICEKFRNYVLIVLGACTALRISDLLRLRGTDVYDERRRQFHKHIHRIEHKTGKQKTIALNPQAIQALKIYLPHRRGKYIFSNGCRHEQLISRVQAWRIIHTAADKIGITDKIACHSLRKTWGYHAWTVKRISPVVLMDIYNHSSYEITRRYLGIA